MSTRVIVDGISHVFPRPGALEMPMPLPRQADPDLVPAESGPDPGVVERGASLDRQSLPGEHAIGPLGDDTSHGSGRRS